MMMVATANFRWNYKQGVNGPAVLQQAHEDRVSEKVVWIDIPIYVPEIPTNKSEGK